jgi:hypothetical protein
VKRGLAFLFTTCTNQHVMEKRGPDQSLMEDAAGTEVVVLAEWVRHGVAEERGQAVLAALVPHLSGGSDGGDDVERYEDDDSPSPAEFRAVQRLMPWLFADTTPRGCLAFLLEELPCATSPAPAQLGCHTATSLMMTKEEVFAALAPVVLQRFIAGVHARSSPHGHHRLCVVKQEWVTAMWQLIERALPMAAAHRHSQQQQQQPQPQQRPEVARRLLECLRAIQRLAPIRPESNGNGSGKWQSGPEFNGYHCAILVERVLHQDDPELIYGTARHANIAIAVQRELTHMCVIVCVRVRVRWRVRVRVRVRVRCDYAAGMRLVKALDKSGFTAPKPLADCLMQLTHHENQDVRQTLARRLPWIGLPLESYHSVPSLCLPHCWLFFFGC